MEQNLGRSCHEDNSRTSRFFRRNSEGNQGGGSFGKAVSKQNHPDACFPITPLAAGNRRRTGRSPGAANSRADSLCLITLIDSARLKEMVASIGLVSTIVEVEGIPTDLILAQAENSRVDLIILGSHSRGPISHLFLGSVADGVLPRARCPVLIVPLSEA